MFKLFFKLKKA